jgi:hypothetical protein
MTPLLRNPSGALTAALLTMLCFSAGRAVQAQGFGVAKDSVTLHRKLPAIFHLTGTAVSVKATGTSASTKPLADQLGTLLETALQHNDSRITIESKGAQTVITCTITSYSVPKIQTLTRENTSLTKKGTQSTGQQYKKVTGSITAAYKARDAKTGKTLDAATVEAKVNEDYDAGGGKTKSVAETVNPKRIIGSLKHHEAEEAIPASVEDVNQILLRQLVLRIASRVVNTDETVPVLLAKGKLSEASKLGASGLWPRMLEATEAVPPFAKSEDEAYRRYNEGVAYEAMGYQTENPQEALKFFQQAAINYGKAIDGKPSEKYFREPQNRIEQALVIMKTLSDRRTQPVAAATTEAASGGPDQSEFLTNEQIIELAKSGMDDDNLIANIKEAKTVKFDLSINGQKQLMQGGISNKVLSAMRLKAKGAGVPQRTRPAAPAAKKP